MILIKILNKPTQLLAVKLHSNRGDPMLRWYDYLIICMFAYTISQGLIYSFFWAFLGWVSFIQYMHQRRDGRV
jgi:hypothetical protein